MSPRPKIQGLLHHGGGLRVAAERYGIPLADWLDVSTGINPRGWPVPAMPAATWSRLPEDSDGLEQAARDYYRAEYLLPVAGSQAAIQALPQLRVRARVSVLNFGYAEHAHTWRRAGHAVTLVNAEELNDAVAKSDVMVLIHPNNPTGARFETKQLLDWHAQLAMRGGWLVIDEAFMDATPENSVASHTARPGLIVLRSMGKFFGLAGARVGFVCAHTQLLSQLANLLGPWSVNAPARWVASAALKDRSWQNNARRRLLDDSARLRMLLTRHNLAPHGGCALFHWTRIANAEQLHTSLARRGILTRLFCDPLSLRFGLPECEADWIRLDAALIDLVE